MFNHFNYTREATLGVVKGLDESKVDSQPEKINNTLRWHVGHILVTAEALLLGFPNHSKNIPEEYKDLFSTGTKPADWPEKVPSLSEIISHLKEQQKRINDLNADFFDQDLPFELPFGNFKTYGDIFLMITQHEAEHIGQMKVLNMLVNR
ncbi:DinB family protein [Virgibacillus oceani]